MKNIFFIMLYRMLSFFGASSVETKHVDSAVDCHNGSIILTPVNVSVMTLTKEVSLVRIEYLTTTGIYVEVELRTKQSDSIERVKYFKERLTILASREITNTIVMDGIGYWVTDTWKKNNENEEVKIHNSGMENSIIFFYHGDAIALLGFKNEFYVIENYSELVELCFKHYYLSQSELDNA